MTADVAIVGNGVAAYACAARLARHGIRPLLIGPGLPVDRPPLTKAALADGAPRLLADEARLRERGIDRLDGVVTAADLASRQLTVETADGTRELDAERLVLAVGLRYELPPVPGLDGAYVNANPPELVALASLLARGRQRVLVVGAGLIGTESAATLAVAGHEVTVVDMLERPLDRVHDPVPALALRTLGQVGARFLGGVHIERIDRGVGLQSDTTDLVSAVTKAHGTLTADVVIAATGGRSVAPPGLPEDLELPLAVDQTMRVPGFEDVHAVGDLVLVPHARFGSLRFPHWDAAIGTGEHAANVIAGEASSYERLPYWWSDIGPLTVAEVGVAELVAQWRDEDGMYVGRDDDGVPVCAMVVDEPRRLREARALVLRET